MFEIFKKKTPTLKVCMLGGKGAGKSSVLTALYKNMEESICDSKLYIRPEDATITLLNNKFNELLDMFAYSAENGAIPPAGIAGDTDVSLYKFKFGMKDTNVSMNIEIKDFPGEKVEDNPEMVQQFIEESNAILIAIDTPHLLEENGTFNEAKNCCQIITSFFIQYLKNHPQERKLIIFVPLKCEKYYHENSINIVTAAIKKQYKELLDYIKNNNKLSVCTTITPILTVGDIVFDKFNKNADESIKVVSKGNTRKMIPAEVIYKYRNSTAKYNPEYCEQPLLYLLTYMAKEYYKLKETGPDGIFEKILKRLKGIFNLIGDNPEFLLEVNTKLKRKRITENSQKGYETITGKNLI